MRKVKKNSTQEDMIEKKKPVEGTDEGYAEEVPSRDKADESGEERSEAAEESEKKKKIDDQEFARMQQEVQEANDMMLRLAAELDNYKKRTAKERESLLKYAAQDLIRELLPVLDNFERAIESARKSRDFDSFLEGVTLIYKNMCDVLEKKGVRQIKAVGEEFDPNIHEAVAQLPSDEHPENVVLEELQTGYMLHDRVIRPSMVAVSKKPEEK